MSPLFLLSYAVLWLLVMALSVAVYVLLRHEGQLLIKSKSVRENQGPDIGSPLPQFNLRDYSGTRLDISANPGRPTLIVLAVENCQLCERALPALRDVAMERSDELNTTFVYPGTSADFERLRHNLTSLTRVVHDPRKSVIRRLRVTHTPFGILVDPYGVVLKKAILNDRSNVDWLLEPLSDSAVRNRRPLKLEAEHA